MDVELDTGKGLAVLDACRKLGITEQTYYRWKKGYGGSASPEVLARRQAESHDLRNVIRVRKIQFENFAWR